jgi:adenylosuccinate lyase
MIERYSRKEMVKICSLEETFNIWFQLEAHACDAQAELGAIPKKSAEIIWEKGKFDIEKIDEIEKNH